MKKNRGYFISGFFILLFLLILFSNSIINFIVDYNWFKELGYTETFLTELKTSLTVGIPTFIMVFIGMYSYLIFMKKRYYKKVNISTNKAEEKKINIGFGILTAVISFFTSIVFANNLWFTILKFLKQVKFSLTDPIFSKDISFYMFSLPLLKAIASLFLMIIFLLILITFIFYMVMLVFRRPQQKTFTKDNIFNMNRKNLENIFDRNIFQTIMVNIGILGFMFFLVVGLNYFLNTYELLYSPRGVAYGASYTDVNISLWMYRAMAVAAIVSGPWFLYKMIKEDVKGALIGPIVLILHQVLL